MKRSILDMSPGVNPGNEAMISVQDRNDPGVLEMLSILEEIKELIKAKHRPGFKITDTDEFKELGKKLSKAITKRFGIEHKINFEDPFEFSVEKLGPETYMGPLALKDTIDFLTEINNNRGTLNEFKESTFYKNVKEFDKFLNNTPLVIDLDKAKFTTWPKGVKAEFGFNLVSSIATYVLRLDPKTVPEASIVHNRLPSEKVNPAGCDCKTILAAMLHEIGHVFTYFSYLHQSRSIRASLEDTVKEQLKKGNNLKGSLAIGFKKAFGKNVDKDAGPIEIMIDTYASEMIQFEYNGAGKDTVYSNSTDIESLADQFVARFGYAPYNALAVLNLEDKYKRLTLMDVYRRSSLLKGLMGTSSIIGSLIVIGGFGITGLVATMVPVLGAWLCGNALLNFEANLTGERRVYDSSKRRLERLKIDIIRQLRNFDKVLSPKQKEEMINEIELLDESISKFKNTFAGNLSKYDNYTNLGLIEKLLSPKTVYIKELHAYEMALEEAMENELHLTSAKFEVLASKM